MEELGYTAWYKRISALNGNTNTGKPNETTIAYMAETNTYLMKRINVLETKLAQDTQVTNHDPTTIATLMNKANKSWAAMVAKLANLKQLTPLKARTTQTPVNPSTPDDPTADPQCLII